MNEYSINKLPNRTYIGKAIKVKNDDGLISEKRYITKVFDIEDFQEFYKDLKKKQVVKVLREGQREEVTAIIDSDSGKFSLRIQRFTKNTGMPHCQSFSFHSGALIKLIDFIGSLGFIDFSNKNYFKLEDKEIKNIKEFWLNNNEVINNIKNFNLELVKNIFSKIANEKKLGLIIDSLSEIEIENLDATIKQAKYKKSIKDLEELLGLEEKEDIVKNIKNYPELSSYIAKQPEEIFKKWIENNLWVFGIEYFKKHNWRIISNDSVADIIMETADGFIDLIELKRPKISGSLFIYDNSHKGYYPSSKFSQSIGQCLLYLKKLDEQKNNIEEIRSTKVLKPRIKLIIGRTNNFKDEEIEAMRVLNSHLNHIEIISYDDLLRNGYQFISYYNK